MFFETVGYHTCFDNEDADRTEREAPFKSLNARQDHLGKKQFLSEGYYFWEDDLPSAHWWGDLRYKGSYIIIECDIRVERVRLLDLVGRPQDKKKLLEMAQVAVSRGYHGYSDVSDVPVSEILAFARDFAGDRFPFDAVRAVDTDRAQGGGSVNWRGFVGVKNGPQRWLADDPQYIICLFHQKDGLLQSKKIVHPEHYCQ